MIARYYFKHKCFYYNWIDEIEVESNNKKQLIDLPYRIDNIRNNLNNRVYQEILKENIFEKLVPPTVSELVYVPKGPNSGIVYIRINKIRNGQQISKLLKNGLLQKINEVANTKFEIQRIKNSLLNDSRNTTNRFKLALLYIKVGNIEEALSELNILIYKFKIIEVKILFSLVTTRNNSILKNLHNYNFGYYFQMADDLPDNTEVEITIDRELFRLGTYRKKGILFPKQSFSKINKVAWKSTLNYERKLGNGNLFSSRIPTSTKLKIYRGLINNQNEIIDEYSELIFEEELSISGLNIN